MLLIWRRINPLVYSFVVMAALGEVGQLLDVIDGTYDNKTPWTATKVFRLLDILPIRRDDYLEKPILHGLS